MKLGELLVREGLITPAELEEALKMQVIFGGRLGTNLIEMGLLEEDEIARVLSRKLRVPFADPSQLIDIPAAVIAALPREIAERHKVIPLRLENRRLTLAMANPADLRAIDEIAFRTGFVVQPVVTPEVRLIQALESYYQVNRDLRYIPVSRPAGVKRTPVTQGTSAAQTTQGAKGTPGTSATSSAPALAADVPRPAPAPPRPPVPAAAPVAAASPVAPPPQPAASVTKAAVLPADQAKAPAPAPTVEPEPVIPLEEIDFADDGTVVATDHDLETVARHLAEAGSREDIADLVIGWAGARFRRAALLLVRADGAQGWRATLDRRPIAGFDRLRIPLAEPSAFKTVADSRSWSIGPMQRTPFNSLFLQESGGGVPQTALLLPLLMMGRLIAILYVDGHDSALQEQLLDLQKLAAKMVMAFEILVLKNKIVQL